MLNNFKGFAELKNPNDLIAKLQHDLDRILRFPNDQYAAFDFFVTAEHVVDWVHPKSKENRKTTRSSSPLLRITSHIANGMKHFEATATHHRAVESVQRTSGVFAAGVVAKGYSAEGSLVIRLTAEEERSFGRSSIEVQDLARQVYEHWKSKAGDNLGG